MALRIGLLLLALIFAWTFQSAAQRFTVSGYVEDAASGERLASANVWEEDKLIGTSTNKFGFFSLSLPRGTYQLSASFVSYNKETVTLNLRADTLLVFKLKPNGLLDEVVVEGSVIKTIQERTEMSQISVPVAQLNHIPALLGERDVLKAIQMLPGVQSGNEGFSGFFVRGGTPDQNLMLLDGVPVYNASHLFGFFSVFNSDAIKNVTLHKGGFPARFGGRLSSVLEIDLKEGHQTETHGTATLGMVASRFTIEGPITKNKTSYVISGRRTLLDLLLRPLQAAEDYDGYKQRSGVFFYDLSAKVNHTFDAKNRLYFSVYSGKDKFYDDYRYDETIYETDMVNRRPIEQRYSRSQFDLNWGNVTSALRWNHLVSNRMFVNTTLSYSRYDFVIDWYSLSRVRTFSPDTTTRDLFALMNSSGVTDFALRSDADFLPNNAHTIRFGGSVTKHEYRPEATQTRETRPDTSLIFTKRIASSPPLPAVESFLYVSDDWAVSDALSLSAGLHTSMFNSQGETFFSLEPRLALRWKLDDENALKWSYTRMRQYVHLLTNVSISLPTDLWIPSGNGVRPQGSHQVAAGWVRALPKGVEFSVEAYYKQMNNLIEYKAGAQFIASDANINSQLETNGIGRSYGTEWLLQKKTGRTTGWIAYTLNWSWREFEAFNGGRPYPFKYDRRHDLAVVLTHQLNRRIALSANWVYSSGIALSLPDQKIPVTGEYETILFPDRWENPPSFSLDYSQRNSFRVDAYHRLDLSVRTTKKKRHWTRHWNFGVYNAYSRMNPFFVYNEPGSNRITQLSLFPIIPSISYELEF